jgi:carboxylesterase
VLVHGFTATPDEVRSLGDALAARGHPCRAVCLPGHDTTLDDLADVGRTEWVASVEDAVATMAAGGARVAVAGMSLGALLALHVAAARRVPVAGLVLCATPLFLADRRMALLPLLGWTPWARRRWAVLPKRHGRDILDPEACARSRAYAGAPLPAALEFLRLRRSVGRELRAVTQPTLILHGRRDRVAPVDNVARLARALGAAWIETAVFDRSAHVITEDAERAAVAARAADFLDRLDATPPA